MTASISTFALDRVSIEVTNRCFKACSFCYNGSAPAGDTNWTADELVSFAKDLAANGVKAVSFGGGEPMQFAEIFDVFARLKGTLFRSMTTNGLLLDEFMEKLVAAAPDKVHISVHFPDDDDEVNRVIEQVKLLSARGITSGINLLVAKSHLESAKSAAERIRSNGIDNKRIVYLPMRINDTPSPEMVAQVAGENAFQSMSCLTGCKSSPRFCSIGWNKSVAWCSYTESRASLSELSYRGLLNSLKDLGLKFCGGTEDLKAHGD